MTQTRKPVTWLLIGLAIFAAAFAAWYFASPSYTLSQMKSAVEQKQSDKLSEYVDYPRLRDNVKIQAKAAMAAEAGNDPAVAAGMALMSGLIDGMIDKLVTPETVEKMMRETANGAKAKNDGDDNMTIERFGLSRFDVVAQGEKPGDVLRIEFARYGLSWKLVGFHLPEVIPGSKAPTSIT